ncbi:MAG: hypothetical protein KF723_22530 [Rhizobiaceae bacterium]|nr:hypothetical protein [Rhizobiaceae bacterium]
MKNVFRVTTTSINPRTQTAYFVNFECTYPTLDLLVSDLNDGKIIMGETLSTKAVAGERGLHEVVHRRPYALAKGGIASIETPHVRFVEYEDEAPPT